MSMSHAIFPLTAVLVLAGAAAGGSLLDLRPDPALASGAGYGTPNLHYRYGNRPRPRDARAVRSGR